MLGQYLPLLALFLLAALFAAGSFVASGLLAPRRPTAPKLDPYECGIVPTRDTPEQFPVRFFLVAMIFIVFDVEIILFYPYAVARGGLGIFGLVMILVFTFAVFESFVYLIGAGALEWGPPAQRVPAPLPQADIQRAAASDGDDASQGAAGASGVAGVGIRSERRTAQTTVRRVGLEGRWANTAPVKPAGSGEPAKQEVG